MPTIKTLVKSILLLLALIGNFSTVPAQGTERPSEASLPSCPNQDAVYSDLSSTIFKIKIDTMVTSSHNRRGDLVQMSVLDDVSTKLLQERYKETVSITYDSEGKANPVVKCERVGKPGDDHVVIPAGTRGYGVVESRRNRKAFWIGGKAQIFVKIKELVLKNGDRLPIEFVNTMAHTNLLPCNDEIRKARQWRPGPTSRAPKEGEQCIEGRRPPLDWAGAVSQPLITAFGTFRKSDDPSYTIAGISLLDKASSFSDLINGTTAVISSGLIFDVKLSRIP